MVASSRGGRQQSCCKSPSVWGLVLAGTCLCTIASGQGTFAPRFEDREAFDRYVQQGWDSPFGLDYVFVHNRGARNQELVDTVCQDVPVRWVNLADLEWKVIEPRPPVNRRHVYNWTDLDGAVKAWQRNGVHIMISMRFESRWATAPKTDREFVYLKGLAKALALAGADYLPKPECMQDLRDYIGNLVERYDGDGRGDMPGLLFPVLHYQVGNEYYNEVYWAGNEEEYGQLLREVSGAARLACPQIKIVLAGIGFQDVFGYYAVGMDPRTAAYVRQHLPKVPLNMRKFLERGESFSRATVRMEDSYDILDARWPNYGIVQKSKELLRQSGCPDKEVWSAEIYSGFPLMEPLVLPNWTLQAWPTPSRSDDYRKILKNPKHARFEQVNAWYRGLHAAQVVKICAVALDAGSRKLMVGWAVDAQSPLAVSTLSHHGLYSITFQKLWPAGRTYGLLIQKLAGIKSIKRINMPEDVYVYRCDLKPDRQVYIAFCDDHVGQNEGEATCEVEAVISLRASQVRITDIITAIDQTKPVVTVARTDRGRLRLKLTEYPVFIEPLAP